MQTETRVYAIDLLFASDIVNIRSLSNEEFINRAEDQGLVWSLNGFEEFYNKEQIPDTWFIRFIALEKPGSIEECEDINDLIESVLVQIKADVDNSDLTAIEALISFIPKENLIAYLPENEK
jgi:hypothetical protein